ncbi:MAG: RagB/SusD family nutrient uptake outer membrane protein [Bacteroidota bacterium]|uniref:RagB/SusD family nutrient uptake outer membrane protein n=1 Tax=Macellibacteroides fermentans TaxID=879969 RepID=UPI00288CF794|nr:RagB/SusD family nutrient uptake outer membrane protein [Bacteroidota bacterium]
MKYKYIVALSFLTFMSLGSCGEDFLYKAPQGSVDENALTNANGVDLLVTNTYANLTENDWGASVFNWTFGGMYGGDANKGSDANDQSVLNTMELYTTLASNGYIDQKWRWVYKGVKRANKAIQVMANVTDMPEAVRKSRTGELKFLRALFYFEGIKVFGPFIPWVDEAITENNPLIHNDKDIYSNVLADLDDAITNLPNTQDTPGRVNVWAAKALKAKILMQKGDMAAAKPILKDVIENGKTSNGLAYGLEDDLDANFSSYTDNGKESIFAVQFSVDTNNNGNVGMSLCYPHGGSGAPGGCCGFYQPSNELANSFKVDANGLPLLDNSYRNGDPVSYRNPSTEASAPLALNNNQIPVDPRLDFAIGRFGIPYKDWGTPKNGWVRDAANGGIYLPKKHVYSKAEEEAGLASGGFSDGWAPGSAMNLQYLSLRDCILLYAECLANDGELSQAMNQVNKIRTRAGLEPNIIKINGVPAANYKIATYPTTHAAFTDKATCIKAVRMERKLELAMEGQRWFDLSRWGGEYMAGAVKDYIDFEKKYLAKFATASYLPAAKTMFPIPDVQIQTMGNDESGKPYLVQPTPWK